MRGISPSTRDVLGKVVDNLFDKMAHAFLGNIPSLKDKKVIMFSTTPTQTLSHLFVQASGNKQLLPKESEVLKNMLTTTHDYFESLKSKTRATLIESIDSYIKDARAANKTPSDKEIREKIIDSLNKAKSHFNTIVTTESSKAKSLGKAINITKAAASAGISDPTVCFITMRDGDVCKECQRLHVMPDKITPRVWKMSELGFSYHKKGEENPKVMGLHPHCRCAISLVMPGFGFVGGKITWISPDHDEYKAQKGIT